MTFSQPKPKTSPTMMAFLRNVAQEGEEGRVGQDPEPEDAEVAQERRVEGGVAEARRRSG